MKRPPPVLLAPDASPPRRRNHVYRRHHAAQARPQSGQGPLPGVRDRTPGSHARKGQIVGRILELLTVHTYIENEVMYPKVHSSLPDLNGDVLESYEEHHVADLLWRRPRRHEP
jgi:hypothetical protein